MKNACPDEKGKHFFFMWLNQFMLSFDQFGKQSINFSKAIQ